MSYPAVPQCYDLERAAAELPPDATKLKVVGHSLATVASLPSRLVHPPPRHSKLDLRDVLARRHCSPISLVDFEHYLAYTEHTVENFYFTMWLQAYTVEYENLTYADQHEVARLSSSITSAAQTYIEPDAPYQLNLSDQIRSDILAQPASPPPPPSVYDVAQKETYRLLEDSLRRWEKSVKSNAGWRRLAFSTYAGLGNACVTIVAMVIARIYMHGSDGRIFAACLTPWLWFAIVGIICGLKGVCLLCFSVGGNVRQVSSFELSLPRTLAAFHSFARGIPTTSVTSLNSPASPNNGSDKTGASGADKGEYPNDPFSPHSARGSEFISVANLHNRSTATMSKAKLVKFWAPMVEVEDPLIVRAYWETVVKGFLWSLLPAIPIGVIVAAV